MSYDEIARCAMVYVEAQRQAEQADDVRLSDHVIQARVALAECLQRAGWTPNQLVGVAVLADRELLGVPVGSFERTPALHRRTD